MAYEPHARIYIVTDIINIVTDIIYIVTDIIYIVTDILSLTILCIDKYKYSGSELGISHSIIGFISRPRVGLCNRWAYTRDSLYVYKICRDGLFLRIMLILLTTIFQSLIFLFIDSTFQII